MLSSLLVCCIPKEESTSAWAPQVKTSGPSTTRPSTQGFVSRTNSIAISERKQLSRSVSMSAVSMTCGMLDTPAVQRHPHLQVCIPPTQTSTSSPLPRLDVQPKLQSVKSSPLSKQHIDVFYDSDMMEPPSPSGNRTFKISRSTFVRVTPTSGTQQSGTGMSAARMSVDDTRITRVRTSRHSDSCSVLSETSTTAHKRLVKRVSTSSCQLSSPAMPDGKALQRRSYTGGSDRSDSFAENTTFGGRNVSRSRLSSICLVPALGVDRYSDDSPVSTPGSIYDASEDGLHASAASCLGSPKAVVSRKGSALSIDHIITDCAPDLGNVSPRGPLSPRGIEYALKMHDDIARSRSFDVQNSSHARLSNASAPSMHPNITRLSTSRDPRLDSDDDAELSFPIHVVRSGKSSSAILVNSPTYTDPIPRRSSAKFGANDRFQQKQIPLSTEFSASVEDELTFPTVYPASDLELPPTLIRTNNMRKNVLSRAKTVHVHRPLQGGRMTDPSPGLLGSQLFEGHLADLRPAQLSFFDDMDIHLRNVLRM